MDYNKCDVCGSDKCALITFLAGATTPARYCKKHIPEQYIKDHEKDNKKEYTLTKEQQGNLKEPLNLENIQSKCKRCDKDVVYKLLIENETSFEGYIRKVYYVCDNCNFKSTLHKHYRVEDGKEIERFLLDGLPKKEPMV